ncbi:MAG: PilZ domain-containing protein [Halieaceae bacterium]|jgi:hypothetical protein|nr:PilZ domain-containing protein [Halieaceae bacterium]
MNDQVRSAERRQYYRINDVVLLRYEIVPDAAGDEGSGQGIETGSLEISSSHLLAEIDRELNNTINIVWREHPAVAQALGLLNRKISIVAARAFDYEESAVQSYDDTRVNMSGCGIAFEARDEISPGTRLRLNMILSPSQVNLSITGTVVSCEKRLTSSATPCWIRVNFDDDLQAQEQLIQHVVQKQGAQLSDASHRDGKD